jgi:hypothetical protein
MSITAHSLLSRPKMDCDVGYDTTVKGASVVVRIRDAPFTGPVHVQHSHSLTRAGTPMQPGACARLPVAFTLKRSGPLHSTSPW